MEFWKGQSYTYLRRKEQAHSRLFEDSEFPAEDQSIWIDGKHHHAVEWKRPKDLCLKPQLVVGELEASKFEMGKLGNAWFATACATLSRDRKIWNKVIPNWRDQDWDHENAAQKYAGIFKFRLWIQGKFYEVVVDDRLPTVGNHLLFCHTKSTNEFWCALLEKACAKIAGSYEALASGHTVDGLVHFTGGIPNIVDLGEGYRQDLALQDKLFKDMFDAVSDASLMTCNIHAPPEEVGTVLECGLVKGRPYVISDVKLLTPTGSLKDYVRRDEVRLIRLVYPWGDKEWNGAWSDGSRELSSIPVDEVDFISKHLSISDGEFWMSFEDWLKWFDDAGIVYIVNNRVHSQNKLWHQHQFKGKWVDDQRSFTAGGCVNYPDTFLKNPQYCFTLDVDKEVMISLEQTQWRGMSLDKETGGPQEYRRIGYHVMKSEDNRQYRMHIVHEKAFSVSFTNYRSTYGKERYPAGCYVVVPSTYECDQEGEFIMRINTETPVRCCELIHSEPQIPLWKCGLRCLYTPNALVLVTLEHGEDLMRVDTRGRGADPYCVVSVAGQTGESSIRWNTRNPIWNSQVVLHTRNPWQKTLTVKVYNKQLEGIDTFLGQVQVKVPGTSYLMETRRHSLPLGSRGCRSQGDIQGNLQFIVTTNRDLYSI